MFYYDSVWICDNILVWSKVFGLWIINKNVLVCFLLQYTCPTCFRAFRNRFAFLVWSISVLSKRWTVTSYSIWEAVQIICRLDLSCISWSKTPKLQTLVCVYPQCKTSWLTLKETSILRLTCSSIVQGLEWSVLSRSWNLWRIFWYSWW